MNRPDVSAGPSGRCKCKTLKGDQCTKKTIDGIYCAMHKKKCRYDFGQQENNIVQENDIIKLKIINELQKLNNELTEKYDYKIKNYLLDIRDLYQDLVKCKKEKDHILRNIKHGRETPKGMVQLEDGMFDLFDKKTPSLPKKKTLMKGTPNRRMVHLDEDGGMFDLFEKQTPKKLSTPKLAFPFTRDHHTSNFMSNRYARSSFCG